MVIERFFPGYIDDLLAQGAHPTQNEKISLVTPYGLIESSIKEKNATSSRALLEWTLRQRLQQTENIHFLTNHEVIDLQLADDLKKVTGVTIEERGSAKEKRMETADLIVDASGRASKVSKWLETIGFDVNESSTIRTRAARSVNAPHSRNCETSRTHRCTARVPNRRIHSTAF